MGLASSGIEIDGSNSGRVEDNVSTRMGPGMSWMVFSGDVLNASAETSRGFRPPRMLRDHCAIGLALAGDRDPVRPPRAAHGAAGVGARALADYPLRHLPVPLPSSARSGLDSIGTTYLRSEI